MKIKEISMLMFRQNVRLRLIRTRLFAPIPNRMKSLFRLRRQIRRSQLFRRQLRHLRIRLITQIPAETETVDRGTLSLEAKVSDRTGGTKAVKAEKFYLLDKDLESILDDANIAPIEGQSLKNSFGLSVLYPDKYSKVRDKALSEINKHIKYDVTTDSTGKAQMKDIKPDSYYIFAITKTANGFAIWSSPIGVKAGQNNLNLSPQPMVEVQE